MSPQPQAAVGAPLSRVDGRIEGHRQGRVRRRARHRRCRARRHRRRERRPRTHHVHRHPRRRVPAGRTAGGPPPQRTEVAVPRQRRVQQPGRAAAAGLPGRPGALPRPAGRRRDRHHPGGRTARREPGRGRLRRRAALHRPLRGPARRGDPLRPRRRRGRPARRRRTPGPDLPHGAQPPQPDGAARHHRPLGWQRAHRVGQDPVGGGHADGTRGGVRSGVGRGARHLPVRRGRFRHGTALLAARGGGRAGRPRDGAAGQARAQP